MALKLHVECYAGYKSDERPIRFRSYRQHARTFEVKEILDQWYGPGSRCFKVRADDGHLYVLRHDESEDQWTLNSFRRVNP
jgi:hypothetical protein